MVTHEQRQAADRTANEMNAAYVAAKAAGGAVYRCSPPIDLSAVVKLQGTTQATFPFPGTMSTRRLGYSKGLGLGRAISVPTCESMQYDQQNNGFWLELKAKGKGGVDVISYVLVLEDSVEINAIKLTLTLSQRQIFDGYNAAKSSPNQIVKFKNPIALDDQIVLAEGGTQSCFALPGGRTMGREGFGKGLGLGGRISSPTCHSIEFSPQHKGFWLELKAQGKNGALITSFVLVAECKEGKEAIQLTLTPSQRQMFDGYNAAEIHPNQTLIFKYPIALDDQITLATGTTHSCFALPGGRAMGREGLGKGLSLRYRISSPTCNSMEFSPALNAFWLYLAAKDANGAMVSSYVLVDKLAAGKGAVRLALTSTQRNLFDSYQTAKRTSSLILDLELRDLVGSQNQSKARWLTPSGETLKIQKSLSLAADRELSSFKATQLSHLGDDRFVIWTTAQYADGGVVKVRLLSSNDNLTVVGATESSSAQSCKGFALDRYAAHLAALANFPTAYANPYYPGSALTGENYMPNMQIGSTICHSKWGGDAGEVFEYILRYGRMMRWHGISNGLVLLASQMQREALQTAAAQAGDALSFNIGVDALTAWGNRSITSPPDIAAELNTLQALADLALDYALKERRYNPTIEKSDLTPSLTTPPASWQERIGTLTTQESYETLLLALDNHIRVHSPFWEESYHLTLAKSCSFLLENRGELTADQHAKVKEKALILYPELENYIGAWRTLASEVSDSMPRRNQALQLVEFKLAERLTELQTPKAPTPKTPLEKTSPRRFGAVIEIPELRAFEHAGNNVTAITLSSYIAQAEALKQNHPNATSQIADVAFKATCRVLAKEISYWTVSETLASYKTELTPTHEELPKLQNELRDFEKAVTLLTRIEKLYETPDQK